VAAPDDPVSVYDHRANGDASFQAPLPGFLDRGFEKLVRGMHLLSLNPNGRVDRAVKFRESAQALGRMVIYITISCQPAQSA
jgi:hypothetical protein